MSFLSLIQLVLPSINKLLDRIPDPNARFEAQQEMMANLLAAEVDLKKGQVELNKVEAQHKSIFIAGWRPAIGWIGAFALAWSFIGHPLVLWVATVSGYTGPMPELQTEELLSLVFAMLGVGAMRSFDKMNGVSTETIRPPKTVTQRKPQRKLND